MVLIITEVSSFIWYKNLEELHTSTRGALLGPMTDFSGNLQYMAFLDFKTEKSINLFHRKVVALEILYQTVYKNFSIHLFVTLKTRLKVVGTSKTRQIQVVFCLSYLEFLLLRS